MIKRTIIACERWLRLDFDAAPLQATRGRAIYALGLVYCVTQLLNLGTMWLDYGTWTTDHWVSVGTIGVIASVIAALRWTKAYGVFALFFSTAMIVGVMLAAQSSGINSSLLPTLVWGPLACGIIAGWRAVAMCTAAAMALSFHLYGLSTGPDAIVAAATGREFQRLVQVNLALLVCGTMSGVFSHGMAAAFARLEETAARAQRAEATKSDFLAAMSHELRTPLNGVLGLTDALAAGDLAPRERQLTETIQRSGQSLLGILNDLLDLSKIEAGKLRLEPAPFDVRMLVTTVGEAWVEGAAKRSTVLTTHVADDVPPTLLGDDLRLRQILNNFVSNAVKFTEGGKITLTLETAADGALLFRVTDTGRGIPEAHQADIFEPFSQGESGTTKKYGGTGLGLPICRHLASLMDGDVALERSNSKGTAFTLTVLLPVAEQTNRRAAPLTDDRLRGLRVLVAEDNAVNRMVAGEFLGALGIEVTYAEDGLEAVEAAKLGGFDAILMDKHMPRMDGVEATRAIRAIGGTAGRVPIIAATADAMTGEREAMLAAGMDGFVSKPLRPDALRAAIGQTVTRPGPSVDAGAVAVAGADVAKSA